MKTHTSKFKQELIKLGKKIDSIITYGNTILHDELYEVSVVYNGNILKSVMKQLNIESSVDIPLGTVINYQLGVYVTNAYEYLDYGNYVVYKSEKQEDTNTYLLTCYDKMLYSMKDYESLGVTYPVTIRNYINALCTKIGLTFANNNETFANYNKQIINELYLDVDGNSLGYTYRDVLDELAEVTASTICINSNDELEIRYITDTNDTINEEYLKDINVKFGEQYGTINTIVLSRNNADNIYYPSILPENPVAIKIIDNQIMNGTDRDTYLPDIYNRLNGLSYYINDFNSTGILYYDLCDRYNVQIGNNIYSCVMFNDEINITSGIEEIIYTQMPEQAETDYTKADSTDRRINQTNLIVDKHEQKISSLITQIGDRSQKETSVTQDIDTISQQISDIEDVTDEIVGTKTLTLNECVEGYLLELHIYGNNTVFEYLRCANDLIISDDLKVYGDSEIIVTDENNNSVTYELGIKDVLRQNGSVYDEYVLDNGIAKVIRRINTDGTIKQIEEIEYLGEYSINVSQGTNTITIKNYSANLKAKFAIQNDFTEVFATKVEMNSAITQSAEEINLEVRKKVDENEVISKINQSAEDIQIQANKISLDGKTIDLTSDDINIDSTNFKVDKDGNMTCKNAIIDDGSINLTDIIDDKEQSSIKIVSINELGNKFESYSSAYGFYTKNYYTNNLSHLNAEQLIFNEDSNSIHHKYIWINNGDDAPSIFISLKYYQNETVITPDGITTPQVTQTSKEENKKNFEKFKNGLDVIKNTEIYKYNLKSQNDNEKKHIGFVIGDNYKYSKEITSKDNDGVDIYSFVSVCCKAIQEQQEQIENLQKEINQLKGGTK